MGTSEKVTPGLQGPSMGLIYGNGEGLASTYAAELRLTGRDADGGVPGSYPPEVMDMLLRYHNDAPAVGGVALGGQAGAFNMGGELIKG